jgi:uncharacterized membrane protein
MHNERRSETYTHKTAARPPAKQKTGSDTDDVSQLETTVEIPVETPDAETVQNVQTVLNAGTSTLEAASSTSPLPDAPEATGERRVPAPASEDTAVAGAIPPGPRRSSGPFPNEVMTSLDLAPPPPPPDWMRSPVPPHVPVPQQVGGAAHHNAILTHVPWQASDSWGATTLNISANTAAGGSYLIWWVTGFLIYFSERNNRFVRFHALQSIILTGILTILAVFAALFATIMQDLTAATHQVIFSHLGIGGAALLLLTIAFVWLWAMVAAWTGNYLRLPVIGPYAERYSAPPTQPTRNPLL